MFISRHREKLINAVIYFVEHTRYCNTIKLFKLLNFLDFEHFRQTGESVTGLDYHAWEQGPVPTQLWHELKQPRPDLSKAVDILVTRDELTDVPQRRDFRPKSAFNSKLFTRRELKILERLSFFFEGLTADQMSGYSHSPRMPWKKVFDPSRSKRIPYQLTLESDAIIKDMPTIDREELEFREDALKEVRAHTDR